MKYKLTFLGVNSFFSNGIDQFHSNLFLENEDGKALLIDCGTDLKVSLAKAGKKVENIDAVYVSHLHSDHCGALEWLGFYTHFITKKKPTLYTHYSHIAAQPYSIWETMKPSMEALDDKNATLKDYFYYSSFDYPVAFVNQTFTWSDIKFVIFPFSHIKNKDQIVFSYGLFFEINGKKVLFTSDTKENVLDFPDKSYGDINPYRSDIIFHDCETFGLVNPPGSNVHAHYEDLVKSDPGIKAKTWLYHYQNLGDKMPDAKKDGFAGFVQTGQVFDF